MSNQNINAEMGKEDPRVEEEGITIFSQIGEEKS